MIDTHCHLYLDDFDQDRDLVISRAREIGITSIVLPNIDKDSVENLVKLSNTDPDFFKIAIGLHPTSVKMDYEKQLKIIFDFDLKIVAIGEAGIDLYWDKTWIREQKIAFDFQLNLACERQLPIIIHSRNSLVEVIDIVSNYKSKGITGVFHCFPGNTDDAKKIIDLGFYIGIGGVVTYKNNNMTEVVKNIPVESILTETDSPYLTPVPYRGKRNEPSYTIKVIEQIALLKNEKTELINNITSSNARKLFKI